MVCTWDSQLVNDMIVSSDSDTHTTANHTL